jgi:hypothetical protein
VFNSDVEWTEEEAGTAFFKAGLPQSSYFMGNGEVHSTDIIKHNKAKA